MMKKCLFDDCIKRAQYGFEGMCVNHAKEVGIEFPEHYFCYKEGCQKRALSRDNGMCRAHNMEKKKESTIHTYPHLPVHAQLCNEHVSYSEEFNLILKNNRGNTNEKKIINYTTQYKESAELFLDHFRNNRRLPLKKRIQLKRRYPKG